MIVVVQVHRCNVYYTLITIKLFRRTLSPVDSCQAAPGVWQPLSRPSVAQCTSLLISTKWHLLLQITRWQRH